MTENKIPVGICPEHGVVEGDDVEFNFPNPSFCSCGETLQITTIAPESEIPRIERRYAELTG